MKKVVCCLLVLVLCLSLAGCSGGAIKKAQTEKAEEVLQTLKDYGFAIEEEVVFTAKTDPNGKKHEEYEAKINFADQNFTADEAGEKAASGSIEVCASAESAEARAKKLASYSELDYYGYIIVKENVVLRINTLYSSTYAFMFADALDADIHTWPSSENIKYTGASFSNMVCWIDDDPNFPEENKPVFFTSKPGQVAASQVNALKLGMTYEEVCQILGGYAGEMTAGIDKTSGVFTWVAEDILDGYVICSFMDDSLYSISSSHDS